MQSCWVKGEEQADADSKQISERMQCFITHMPATSGVQLEGVGTLKITAHSKPTFLTGGVLITVKEHAVTYSIQM